VSILTHIAQDVGQLHRDAELDCVWQRLIILTTQNRRHHETDRSRHVIAVAAELVPRRKATRPKIHPYAREEISGGRHRHPVMGSRGRESDRNGMRRSLELPLPGVERVGSGGRVRGMVGDVVGDAAERVSRVDRPPPARK
jgi:hypothetical protein